MTFSSSNTTEPRTDALEEAPFDPDTRQIGSDGLSYVDFHAALCGEPDPDDPCNARIKDLVRQGRSEAFCWEYRQGYDGAARSIQAVRGEGFFSAKDLDNSTRILCSTAGLNRACEAFPNDQPGDKRRRQITAGEVQQAIERRRLTQIAFPGYRPEEIADTARNRAHLAGIARAAGILDANDASR